MVWGRLARAPYGERRSRRISLRLFWQIVRIAKAVFFGRRLLLRDWKTTG